MKSEDFKELDELISYIEEDLLPDNCDKKIIHEAICMYAELWHAKQVNDKQPFYGNIVYEGNISLEQLIEIARVGFPERVSQFINYDNCEIFHHGGVYRLYDKDTEFRFNLPKENYLTIFIGGEKFVQITCGNTAFNHYAAIKKMEELNII